ncbi:MAG: hypothetical protein HY713_00285 [candidate division NC10 bacterium]|nr:hypothetical protein [candidate division NC10 bacterium]
MAESIQDAEHAQKRIASPHTAAGGGNAVLETYCPFCGRDASDPSLKRFGEYFCSEEHVAEYAREARSKQTTEVSPITTVAEADDSASQTTGPLEPGQTPQKKGGIGGFWKMAACCGGMLLLLPALGLVNLGGVAAVGGSLLSLVAVLACPIGMYLMMRMMMKQGQGRAQPQADGREDRPRLPGDQTPPSQ